MPNGNRFRGITTEARTIRCAPIRLETVTDLRSDPNNIIVRGIDYGEIVPPRDREEFMNWYLARRLEDSSGMSSREVQAAMRDAEDVWRFVSGDPDDLAERAERAQLWSRTYINALDRRKGNAVVAVTIRC